MASFEFCVFAGHLGRDFEVKESPNGVLYARNSIAVNRVYYNSNDEKVEQLKWINFALYQERAENAEKYLKKGDYVILVGYLESEDDGNPKGYFNDDDEFIPQFDLHVTEMKYGPSSSGKSDYDEDKNSASRSSSRRRRSSSSRGNSSSRSNSSSRRRSAQRERPSRNKSQSGDDGGEI